MNKIDLLRRGMVLRLLSKYLKFDSCISGGTLYLKSKVDMLIMEQMAQTNISIISEFLHGTATNLNLLLVDSVIQFTGDMHINAEQIQLTSFGAPIIIQIDITSDVMDIIGLPIQNVHSTTIANMQGQVSMMTPGEMASATCVTVYFYGTTENVRVVSAKSETSVLEFAIRCPMSSLGIVNVQGSDCLHIITESYAHADSAVHIGSAYMKNMISFLASIMNVLITKLSDVYIEGDVGLSVMNAISAYVAAFGINTERIDGAINASANDSFVVRIEEWYQNTIAMILSAAHTVDPSVVDEWYQKIMFEISALANTADSVDVAEWYQKAMLSAFAMVCSVNPNEMRDLSIWYESSISFFNVMLASVLPALYGNECVDVDDAALAFSDTSHNVSFDMIAHCSFMASVVIDLYKIAMLSDYSGRTLDDMANLKLEELYYIQT